MADEADMAQDQHERFLDVTIAGRRAMLKSGSGSGVCVDCDEPIPAGRMKALPGCERCLECQVDFEEDDK